MKICCSSGKPYDTLTDFERLGGCGNDHCVGPVDVETESLVQLLEMGHTEYLEGKHCSTAEMKDRLKSKFHIEDYFLSSHATFDTKDCVSVEDLIKLLEKGETK